MAISMELELAVEARSAAGKENRRLRREGIVPGVVFGKGVESVPVQLDAKTFDSLYRTAGRTSVLKLQVPGEPRARSAIIKGVQRHPLTGRALHVDFQVVDLTLEMEVDVPLAFGGQAPAVEETGGTLVHNLSHVRIKALPGDIPHEITVDVSTLVDLESAIHVRDLAAGGKFQIVTDPDELVAKVFPPRLVVEEEPELPAEEAEAEEAAAAAATEEGAEEGEAERGTDREAGEAAREE